MVQIKKASLQFDLKEELPLSYGHKLRGFFANRFENVLFHHHKEDGGYRYAYPLIQYKIVQGQPTVVGLEEGAELVTKKFLDIDELILGNKKYSQPEGKLEVVDEKLEVVTDLEMLKYKYKLLSPWLGLNQDNYRQYLDEIKDAQDEEKREFFKQILIGNVLTFATGVDWWVEEEIKVVPNLEEVDVRFKNKDMVGFVGEFFSNVSLPEYIGVGKSSARGFGTISKHELI